MALDQIWGTRPFSQEEEKAFSHSGKWRTQGFSKGTLTALQDSYWPSLRCSMSDHVACKLSLAFFIEVQLAEPQLKLSQTGLENREPSPLPRLPASYCIRRCRIKEATPIELSMTLWLLALSSCSTILTSIVSASPPGVIRCEIS